MHAHSYDFKLYGQGLQAGPGAVPLTSSGHEVLYQPPPPGKAEPGANAAAAAAAAAAKQHQQPAAPAGGYPRTASGTPALPMHGLPVSSSGGRATAPPQQAQRQQQPLLRQHGAAAGTGGQAAAAGAGGRQQARPAAAPRRTGGWLQRAKARSQQLLQDAAEALLLLLYSAVCWLGRMLLIPLRALFAPWYNYNRCLQRWPVCIVGTHAHAHARADLATRSLHPPAAAGAAAAAAAREIKHRSHALLSDQQLDVRQLSDALGALPSWLAGIGGATERLDWLNTLLAQARNARALMCMHTCALAQRASARAQLRCCPQPGAAHICPPAAVSARCAPPRPGRCSTLLRARSSAAASSRCWRR